MKIGVHSQVLTAPNLFGIGYYLYNLLSAMAKIDLASSFYLISGCPLLHTPEGANLIPTAKDRIVPGKFFSYLGFPIGVEKMKCDLAFMPKETTPFGLSVPVVITAFDLYPYKMSGQLSSEFSWTASMHFKLAKLLHFKRAAKILAISEDTKKDLMDICAIPEDRIAVTPLGIDSCFFKRKEHGEILAVRQKFKIGDPFFLNTSSYWWGRKNLVRLIQAYAMAKKREGFPHQLVITGKIGPSYAEMKEVIYKEGMDEHVKLLDYVSREETVALMQAATALIFPSLHEGFGLPILEAMASDCPVVTSNVSAMPEVAGDAAVLIDPLQVESIADGIGAIASDENLRRSLIEKGKERSRQFTWENTAIKTLQAFNQLNIVRGAV